MASPLDLQEQEQVDALKAFWKQYGNLITWTLTLVLAGFAAWNGWNWWQREQGVKAGAFRDVDSDTVARMIMGPLLVHAMRKHVLGAKDASPPDIRAKAHIDLLFEGLAKR